MRVITIVVDSLRKDHLGCYGDDRAITPNIDALEADPDAIRFTNAYPEALPTIPVRTALLTGQRTLPFRPWQPLEKEDRTIPSVLQRHGYVTAMVTDTYHMAKPGMNFHRGFDSFEWIRGQEADAYRTAPAEVDLDPHTKPAMRGSRTERLLEQYLRNTARFDPDDETDFFAAQVMRKAMDWVECNQGRENSFLWVDVFDPHEPWDPPHAYRDRHTDSAYRGPDLIHPKYGSVDWMTDEELDHVRGLYAEEVEFVDEWIGRFLDRLKKLDQYDDTLIVFLSDHGHPLGDHGSIMKTADNLYGELLEIPLVIKPPASIAGEFVGTVEGLVQTDDVPTTILDLLGLEVETGAMHGRSLVPMMRGETDAVREAVITGYHESPHRCVRTEEWSLVVRPKGKRNELYHLPSDPAEEDNLVRDRPGTVAELAAHLGESFRGDRPIKTIQQRSETENTSMKAPDDASSNGERDATDESSNGG